MAAFRRVVAAAALAVTSVLAETQQFATVPLLGGSVDWHFSNWRAVTDQVRGGVSTAKLEPCAAGARFTGNLDPSILKAGFAGMELDVKVLPATFSDLDGLNLAVSDADGHEYTLLVKTKGGKIGSKVSALQNMFSCEAAYIVRAILQIRSAASACPEPKACAINIMNIISSFAWISQFTSLAVSDCWDKGSQKALCAADISDMVAAVTNGPAAGIATTSDCADMPDPLEEEKHLPMD